MSTKPTYDDLLKDITDRAKLSAVFDRAAPDAVINLAARAGVRQSLDNPWVYYETNVTGTLNLFEICRASGISKFVHASTSSAYGDRTEQNVNNRQEGHGHGPA